MVNPMRRIIINIDEGCDHITDQDIVAMLGYIISNGRVSKTAGREHYCHVTTWTDRTGIFATRNTKGTDIFRVFHDSQS